MAFIFDFSYIDQHSNSFGRGGCRDKISNEEMADNNFLTAIYRKKGFNYPKFFKMDNLSKLGFLTSELIVADFNEEFDRQNTGVVCFNRISSLTTDKNFANTINDPNNFYPSPALFVYTLPNIVTGEICIRNKFYGESSFYVSESFDTQQIVDIVSDSLSQNKYLLVGWSDVVDNQLNALMFLACRDSLDGVYVPLSVDAINDMRKIAFK